MTLTSKDVRHQPRPEDGDLSETAARRSSSAQLQEKIVDRDLRLVREALSAVVADGSVVTAAAAIVSARRRFVAGAGISSAYAAMLAMKMTSGLAHVTLVDTFLRTVDIVSEVRDSDTLVVFAFAPYRKASVELARMFHRSGATVIAITDAERSPLVTHARHTVFVAPSDDGTEESASAIAAVSNLLASLAVASAKGARRRIAERARISEELQIYVPAR